jgi:hypothetical protein
LASASIVSASTGHWSSSTPCSAQNSRASAVASSPGRTLMSAGAEPSDSVVETEKASTASTTRGAGGGPDGGGGGGGRGGGAAADATLTASASRLSAARRAAAQGSHSSYWQGEQLSETARSGASQTSQIARPP